MVIAEERPEEIAVPAAVAAQVAGLSRRQVDYWHSTGLVTAGISRRVHDRHEVRLYRFEDLVQLRAVAALRQGGVSLQHIRAVVAYLRVHYAAPLRELRFALIGEEVYFQHPDGTWEGDQAPGQTVLEHVLPLGGIRDELITRLTGGSRSPDQVGSVSRRRGVRGSRPTFAGTRIPVSSVQAFVDRGYPDERILAAYPQLSPADIGLVRRANAG
jgi:uncharacterized protein (DUF433 family)/DNA-binding transcriptional MerR regulator